MSAVRFLLDENLPAALERGQRRREPLLQVARVGQPGFPPVGASDRELLKFCEESGRLLVSRDRSTMLTHIAEHMAAGGRLWGVFLVKRRASLSELLDNLVLVWSATEAAEWRDQVLFLPL